ncbi:hypothetical protein LCGC14_0947970 [marine sediment metagenome]|uniref:Uncharacterized protein n=1 Tax=marine sediment metagenome TaxID=412755 RepID=A0A0F9RPJ7_9ZZZZ
MTVILKPAQMNVQQGMDLVQVRFESDRIRLYYQTTFKICVGLMGSIKFAMRNEGVRPGLFEQLNTYDRTNFTNPIHHEYRRSGLMTNVDKWDVGFEGSLVKLTFNDAYYMMHYSDGILLYAWLRKAAKEAKRWAGDRGRMFSTFARLTDAEADDKVLYV